MKGDRCIWIGIGSDLDKESDVYRECLKINKLLCEKYKSSICFSEIEIPHLNFYDLDFPKKNLEEILSRLSKIISNQKSFEVPVKSINYFPFGLFYIELGNTLLLSKLHESIVKAISPLKENCMCEDYLQPYRKYSPAQKSMLKLHGNPHVLSQFIPHITLGYIREKNLKSIQNEIASFLTVHTLCVNNLHMVTEKNKKKEDIADFDLK